MLKMQKNVLVRLVKLCINLKLIDQIKQRRSLQHAYLRHLSNLSVAEASCKQSIAARTATSLCLNTSCQAFDTCLCKYKKKELMKQRILVIPGQASLSLRGGSPRICQLLPIFCQRTLHHSSSILRPSGWDPLLIFWECQCLFFLV